MKNFTGIQLSEPFTFRLYEDCCEMAEYASDNCIKMLPEKTEELSKIVLSEFGEGKRNFIRSIRKLSYKKKIYCNVIQGFYAGIKNYLIKIKIRKILQKPM